jgi:hypothetical protein
VRTRRARGPPSSCCRAGPCEGRRRTQQRRAHGSNRRGNLRVAEELDIAGAAVAHRGAERMQRRTAFAELDPIELLTHLGLETHERLNWQRRPHRAHERAQLAQVILVTAFDDLTVQHARRYPVRLRRRLPIPQIGLKRCRLTWPFFLAFVFRHRLQR